MTSCLEIQAEASALLPEAAAWRLIGLLFECPGQGWIEQVATLAKEVQDPALTMAAEAAAREASSGLYHSTFGPGGPAAPREVSYRRGVLPGATLAELRQVYAAFAYASSAHEPPDHVAVETGFVAYLCLKRAYALAREDTAQVEVCAAAMNRLLTEHLCRMADPLAAALSASGIAYLMHAAAALRARTGPAPAEPSLAILPSAPSDEVA